MATIKRRTWTNKSGTHEAWQLNYVDANGERHREQFELQRDAKAKRIEVEGQIKGGTYRPDAEKITVREACENYEKHLAGRMRRGEHIVPAYFKNTVGHLWNYISPRVAEKKKRGKKPGPLFAHGIGDTKLAKLTARAVGEFRDHLRDEKVSVLTTRQILATLSRTLDFAISRDELANNVAEGVRVIGSRKDVARKVIPPTKSNLAAVIKAADEDLRIKIKFAAASGVRASELHALRWPNLDLKGGAVTIEERVDAFGNIDTTKSEAGLRTVPLGATICKEMATWRERSNFSKDEDLVFPNTIGGFESHNNMVKRKFNPALAAAAEKIGKSFKRFGWHGLRHFAVSSWIEAGLTPKTIQTFAGHSTLAVTMDRYGHLFPSDDHKTAMDKIAESLFGDGTQTAHEMPDALQTAAE